MAERRRRPTRAARCRAPTPCSPTPGCRPRSTRLGPDARAPRRRRAAQDRVRAGELAPDDVVDAVLAALPAALDHAHARCSTRPGSCCTPTSAGPRCQRRRRRGAGRGRRRRRRRARPRDRAARPARRRAGRRRCSSCVPDAEDALVVNNGAAALRARHHGAGRRRRGGREPRRDGRDRRRLPAARPDRLERRPAARGRHDQPHPPARLRRRRRAGHRRGAQGAPEQLHGRGLHRARSPVARAGRARARPSCTTSAAGCCARTRCCPTSPTPRPPCATAPRVVTVQRRQAARRPAGRAGARPRRRRRAAAPAPPRPGAAGRQDHPRGPRGDPARAARPRPSPRSRPARPRCSGAASAVAAHLARAGIRGRGRAVARPRRRRLGARRCRCQGWAVALPEACAEPLRLGDPAVLARVAGRSHRARPARASTRARTPCWSPPCVRGTAGGAVPDRPLTWRSSRRPVTSTTASPPWCARSPAPTPTGCAEERRRGMTIELGHAWADVDGRRVAFVDVPGHDRLVGTTLAGLGPVAGGAARRRGRRGLAGPDRGARRGRAGAGAHRRRPRGDPVRPRRPRPRHGRRRSPGWRRTASRRSRWPRPSARTGAGLADVRARPGRAGRPGARAGDPRRPGAPVGRPLVHRHRRRHGRHRHPAHRVGDPRRHAAARRRAGAGARPAGARRAGRDGDRPHPAGRQPARGGRRRGAARQRAALPRLAGSRPAWSTSRCTRSPTGCRRTPPCTSAPPRPRCGCGRWAPPTRGSPSTTRRAAFRWSVGDRVVLRDPAAHEVLAGATVLDAHPPPLTRRGDAVRRAAALAARPATPDAGGDAGAGHRRRAGRRAATQRTASGPLLALLAWLDDHPFEPAPAELLAPGHRGRARRRRSGPGGSCGSAA